MAVVSPVVSPIVLKDRHVVDALRPAMKSSFKEVLEEPIPEAWLALLVDWMAKN
jgi:hypothetical protein